jgi:hypothetical protein
LIVAFGYGSVVASRTQEPAPAAAGEGIATASIPMWSCGVNLERLGFMDCNGGSWLGRCDFDMIYISFLSLLFYTRSDFVFFVKKIYVKN